MFFATILLLGTGCASLPEPQVAPTGEPLNVDSETKTYTYTTKEKVGEIRHRDSHGRSAGTSTVYADKKRTGSYTVWGTYQGETKISDDDFFRIARDEAASKEIRESRERGVLKNRIGWAVLAAGMAAAGTGLGLLQGAKDGDNTNVQQGLLYGGIVGFSIGTWLIYDGKSQASAEHPLSQERAERAAENYNQTLPVGSGTLTSGSMRR